MNCAPDDGSNSTPAVNLIHPEFCRYHGFRNPPWHPEAYQRTEVGVNFSQLISILSCYSTLTYVPSTSNYRKSL